VLQNKQARLEAAGWTVGSVEGFLGLTRTEAERIELKRITGRALRVRRKKSNSRPDTRG
jgi:hypothetical protein